jgi:hypothetical protein
MRKLLLLFVVAFAYIGVFAQSTDLFFSEYIEGGGQNKALEIFNGTGASVDLHNYVIRINYNGNAWSEVFTFPEGTILEDSNVYVIGHAEANEAITSVSDTLIENPYTGGTSYVESFNGDDVRALCKVSGNDTAIIDIIGKYDLQDPGSGWAVAGIDNATKDHTLVRKLSITGGNTDWGASAGSDASNSEWIVYDKDDLSHIGWHTTPPSNAADILAFVVDGELTTAWIDAESAQVTSTVKETVDITKISPEITISEGATINPASGEDVDFTNQVTYTVTAQDGTVKEWKVSVIPVSYTLKSIYDIQYTTDESGNSPVVGANILTSGIITGIDKKGYYIQNGEGAWNGIYVYTGVQDTLNAKIADSLVVKGLVKEYYGLTEVVAQGLIIASSDNNVPAATVISLESFGEPYEGVLVKTENVTCSNADLGYGMWEIANDVDSVTVDDDIYKYTATLGEMYESVTGVGTYTYGDYKFIPRSEDDIVVKETPKVSVTFNVDMNDAGLQDQDTVIVTGNFAGWAEPGTDTTYFMTDEDGDGIYSLTVELDENYGELQYKYFKNSGWSGGEWEGDPNRIANVGTDDVVLNDIWGTLAVTNDIFGKLTAYPNPFGESFTVENIEGASQVIVSNVLGQTVMTIPVTGNRIYINSSMLQKGIYFVTVTDRDNNKKTIRLIKQ